MANKDVIITDLTGKVISDGLIRYADVAQGKITEIAGAGFHNSVYRGKSLGTEITASQWSAISSGDFTDLYIGDYWTISSKVYRIAHFDYWIGTGDTECTTHHVIIVPDAIMYSAKMNDTNTTEGAYLSSAMRTTNLATALNTIETAFGSAHILNHRELFANATSSGQASSWTWADSKVDLMSETMVYGQSVWGQSDYETGIDRTQLALFKLNHKLICNRADWWLRGVSGSAAFALVTGGGAAAAYDASASLGVRPCFGIIA